ncbi:MAG: hypothetical protein ACLPYS_04190 [Vulcanimicrobiaceae bacterium]
MQLSAANPLSQEWERDWSAMKARRDREPRELAIEYRAKVADAGDDVQQKKTLRHEQRKHQAAIVKAHASEEFDVWLHRRRERHDNAGQAPATRKPKRSVPCLPLSKALPGLTGRRAISMFKDASRIETSAAQKRP